MFESGIDSSLVVEQGGRVVLGAAAVAYFWGGDFYDMQVVRPRAAKEAREYADRRWKPMLNVGCGPTDWGDVNVDLRSQNVKNFVKADACKLPFEDKKFGSVFASHVLEHLEDPDEAWREWHRVGDRVYVLVPSLWNANAWMVGDHKWIFLGVPEPRIRIPFR